jgi:outer membrane protein insertion porin family
MSLNVSKYLFYALAIGFALASFSCSNTKFLKEQQHLYLGAEVEIESDQLSKKEQKALSALLKSKIYPKANSSILGLRPKLYLYNITKEPKKKKGLRNWLKYKIGEAPVLLGDVNLEFNKKLLLNYAENIGYFQVEASFEKFEKKKKARIVYHIKPGPSYRIRTVKFPTDSSLIHQKIRALKGESLLKAGNSFDLSTIKAERNRIDQALKEDGFYYFSSDHIIVQIDSTVGNHQLDLIVKLKDNCPTIARKQFSIDKLIVLPTYNMQDLKDGQYQIPMPKDALAKYKLGDIHLIDPQNSFKSRTFEKSFSFQQGDFYNRSDHNLSLKRLVNLGAFKFVKNDFIISDSLNHKFDAYYLLTPRQFQSLRFEAIGRTNSANYTGSELNLNWVHRNIFKGAEQLKVALYGEFDLQIGGPRDANNIFRTGIKADLAIPRILTPFPIKNKSSFVPRTVMGVGYEFQNRTALYAINSFNGAFGYLWKTNLKNEHQLKALNISLLSPSYITERYDSIMADNIYLQRVVDQQLIFGPTYSYTFSNTMLPKRNTVYFNTNLDLAGNLIGLVTAANVNNGRERLIFGIPFSQYVKIENDLRYYHQFNKKINFASRLIAGLALPYGNSNDIPFSKQFFAGGSNSIRAFRARTLGPGSYDIRDQGNSFFFDQSGDIKLELNLELRFKLYSFIHLGLFVDAGNIWLVNEDPERVGANFTNDFLSELAMGSGFGLRFDFSILVLRFDLAMPLRQPFYDRAERWAFDRINFGNADWRRENLVLNIAIGYPF